VFGIATSVAVTFAQGRDFSGTWTIDTERTMAEAGATAGGGGGGGAVVTSAGGGVATFGGGGGGRGGGGGGVAAGGGGTMVMARPASGGGGGRVGGGASGGPVPMTIVLDEKSFTIATSGNTTTYKLDGSVTTIETPRGSQTAKAAWKGDKLVIETTIPTPNGSVTTTTGWYLDSGSLVRESSRTGPDGQPIVSKTFYKK
jgi:hypothetical protein